MKVEKSLGKLASNKYVVWGSVLVLTGALLVLFRKAFGKSSIIPFTMGDFKYSKYPLIWSTILKGESGNYNAYNYYKGSKLYGFMSPTDTKPFSSKPLTEMTIGEVMKYQAFARSSQTGQLFAVGRYQIIPNTFMACVNGLKLPIRTLFNEKTQDRMADYLIDKRPNVSKYLNGVISDTTSNLQKSALDIAKEWSSVGVPYAMQGRSKYVSKNQSYYEGGGDKAHVTTEAVQKALRTQRNKIV